jgi:hypothetical protein
MATLGMLAAYTIKSLPVLNSWLLILFDICTILEF